MPPLQPPLLSRQKTIPASELPFSKAQVELGLCLLFLTHVNEHLAFCRLAAILVYLSLGCLRSRLTYCGDYLCTLGIFVWWFHKGYPVVFWVRSFVCREWIFGIAPNNPNARAFSDSFPRNSLSFHIVPFFPRSPPSLQPASVLPYHCPCFICCFQIRWTILLFGFCVCPF